MFFMRHVSFYFESDLWVESLHHEELEGGAESYSLGRTAIKTLGGNHLRLQRATTRGGAWAMKREPRQRKPFLIKTVGKKTVYRTCVFFLSSRCLFVIQLLLCTNNAKNKRKHVLYSVYEIRHKLIQYGKNSLHSDDKNQICNSSFHVFFRPLDGFWWSKFLFCFSRLYVSIFSSWFVPFIRFFFNSSISWRHSLLHFPFLIFNVLYFLFLFNPHENFVCVQCEREGSLFST